MAQIFCYLRSDYLLAKASKIVIILLIYTVIGNDYDSRQNDIKA